LKRNTKFYLINARFGQNHKIFTGMGKPYLNLLVKFNHVFCSDHDSHNLLVKNNLSNSKYTGDSRYDRVKSIATTKEPTINLDGFKSDSNVLVVGSSWPQEEAILTRLMEATDLKIVIAPHDISEARIESIVQLLNQFEPKRISKGYSDSDRLLILDSIGHLSTVYQYADFALVGGGFSGALHNILEPAVWGCHISYGPNTEKFPEAQDFVNQGFAMKIENEEDWTNTISELNADPEKLKAVQQKSIEFVESNTGATATVLSSIMT
jgi:3-deoxy-D-manno-octulosonic-acid transferase